MNAVMSALVNLVKLSEKDGEVRSDYPVESWSNIKIRLMSSNCEDLSGDLYAKVMGTLTEDQAGFAAHFTSIPPDVATFFERLLAESSCTHVG